MPKKTLSYRGRAPYINTERDQFIKDLKAKSKEREEARKLRKAKRRRRFRELAKQQRLQHEANPPNAEKLNWAIGEADKLGMTLSMSVVSRKGTQHWVFKCSSTSRMLLSYYPKTQKGFRQGGKLYPIGDEMAAVEEARKILTETDIAPVAMSDLDREYLAMFAK